jgi:hypothetical protein
VCQDKHIVSEGISVPILRSNSSGRFPPRRTSLDRNFLSFWVTSVTSTYTLTQHRHCPSYGVSGYEISGLLNRKKCLKMK